MGFGFGLYILRFVGLIPLCELKILTFGPLSRFRYSISCGVSISYFISCQIYITIMLCVFISFDVPICIFIISCCTRKAYATYVYW